MTTVRPLKSKPAEQAKKPEKKVDEAIKESFPASDPPAFSTPQKPEPRAIRPKLDAKEKKKLAGT